MTSTRNIALVAAAVTTFVVFCAAMWLLIFGGLFPDNERLIWVSIALGPVAMFAVAAGYAVWWLVMLILSLLRHDEKTGEKARDTSKTESG